MVEVIRAGVHAGTPLNVAIAEAIDMAGAHQAIVRFGFNGIDVYVQARSKADEVEQSVMDQLAEEAAAYRKNTPDAPHA